MAVSILTRNSKKIGFKTIDNTDELTTGIVTLYSDDVLKYEGVLLFINYEWDASSTETGFYLTFKCKFTNPDIGLSSVEFDYPEVDSAYKIQTYIRKIDAGTAVVKFFPLPVPASADELILQVEWQGTLTTLSTLEIGFIPNSINS